MRSQIATFVFSIVLGAEASATHAQLLPRRDLSYSVAKTIAETAVESCTASGYRISAVVVDRDGDTIRGPPSRQRQPARYGKRAPQSLHGPQLSHLD